MAVCLICKREFARLKFVTDHIAACTRCVNTLNDFSEPAFNAQKRLGELLARGMERNALRDLDSADEWRRRDARRTLENLEAAHKKALPGWLNRLLADKGNTTRDYKTVRAHRRGLLRMDGDRPWSYPDNWNAVASGIRKRDDCRCVACGERDALLDVHHIIYLSNYGTNQQSNLVTLCRPCHQSEHGRVFDFGEADDPESSDPIRSRPEHSASMEPTGMRGQDGSPLVSVATSSATSVSSELSTKCPRCGAACKGVFRRPADGIFRCTSCDFMPSSEGDAIRQVILEPDEGLSEGAYVLMQYTPSTDSTPVANAPVQRNEHSAQGPEPGHDQDEDAPAIAKKSSFWRPVMAIFLGVVVAVLAVLSIRLV